MAIARVMLIVLGLSAAAAAQVSAPGRPTLSYEVRDKATSTIHEVTLTIDGVTIYAESGERVGNDFTLRNASLTISESAARRTRSRVVYRGDAIQDFPQQAPAK
jgi:hypothetical protein